jgi:hypothetical protein
MASRNSQLHADVTNQRGSGETSKETAIACNTGNRYSLLSIKDTCNRDTVIGDTVIGLKRNVDAVPE